MSDDPEYDPRYLAGIVLFNERDFFSAHEVWEDLWNDCGDADRRFYQALIQAAVALYHYGQGNLRGAVKLFASSKAYMDRYPSPHLGLDCDGVLAADGGVLHPGPRRDGPAPPRPAADPALIPTIALDPAPQDWPDPAKFLRRRRLGFDVSHAPMNDDQHALANFAGTARLFPLPNLVLFPHVVQPLHVFEPRYRQLTADALAGDRLDRPGPAPARLGGGVRRAAVDLPGRLPRPGRRRTAAAGRAVQPARPRPGPDAGARRSARREAIPHGPRRAVDDGPLPSLPEAKALRKELAGQGAAAVRGRAAAGPVPRAVPRRTAARGAVRHPRVRAAVPGRAQAGAAGTAGRDPPGRPAAALLDALVPSPPVEVDPDRKFPPDFSAN